MDTAPGPVPVYRALKNPLHPNATAESCQDHRETTIFNRSSCNISTVSFTTAPGIQHDLHKRDIDHHLWSAEQKSHGDQTLGHDRDVDDLERHKDFLNEQVLWEDDCLNHNLPGRT